jgi:hypothetical protein
MTNLHLQTILVTYPIESLFTGVFDQLRSLFKEVIFVPGADGSGCATEYDLRDGVKLPTDEQYARADVILACAVPENLIHISQGAFLSPSPLLLS